MIAEVIVKERQEELALTFDLAGEWYAVVKNPFAVCFVVALFRSRTEAQVYVEASDVHLEIRRARLS